MVVIHAGTQGTGKAVKTGMRGNGETAAGARVVPEDGVLTGVDVTLEPGSKGLRDGDTLPTEYADTVGDAAAAVAFCTRVLGPGASAPGDGAEMVLGADC